MKQAQSTDTHKIKEALEDLKEPVKGVIATWKHPYSAMEPGQRADPRGFPRANRSVMGMVKDGRVVFANAGRQRARRLAQGKSNVGRWMPGPIA